MLAIPFVPQIDFQQLNLQFPIGKGGYATVYKASWNGNEVAVKRIATTYTAPIEKEIKLAASLHHPNIVAIYGLCEFPKAQFGIVMQYCEQGNLYDVLAKPEVDIPWQKRWQWAKEAAMALQYLHKQGVIHRDIKSLNFLISNGSLKICDFGMSTENLESYVVCSYSGNPKVGTARWISPETVSNDAMDEKSDVYSLGIVFWELAARKIPFEDIKDDALVIALARNGERPTIPPNCPEYFKVIITQCWAVDPDDRPTARELSSMIEDYIVSVDEPSIPWRYQLKIQPPSKIVWAGHAFPLVRTNAFVAYPQQSRQGLWYCSHCREDHNGSDGMVMYHSERADFDICEKCVLTLPEYLLKKEYGPLDQEIGSPTNS